MPRTKSQDVNAIVKDFSSAKLRVGLVCPEEFLAGKSHLAVQLFYTIANEIPEVTCERIFLPPLPDRRRDVPPVSRESSRPLREFDLLAVSLSFELDYPALLWMLQRSGIPTDRQKRQDSHTPQPFILLGGIAISANPSPLLAMADAIFVGEGDLAFQGILEDCLSNPRSEWGRSTTLGKRPGILLPDNPRNVKRVWVSELDDAPFPVAQILPRDLSPQESRKKVSPLKDSFLLEVNRGCPNWCRFCLAGHVTRPFRNRSLAQLRRILEDGIKATPTKEVTLIGSAVAEHPHLLDLLQEINNLGLRFSLPSVRLDQIDEELTSILLHNGSRSITIAPEVAGEAARRVAGKSWSNQEILSATRILTQAGIRKLKYYFLLGIPNSLESEQEEIPRLVDQIAQVTPANARIKVSVNPFVPKAHTPFAHCTQYYYNEGFRHLSRAWEQVQVQLRKIPKVYADGYEPRWARVQALLGLAGHDIFPLVDAWAARDASVGALKNVANHLQFNLDAFFQAVAVQTQNPWDNIDIGVKTHVLGDELRLAGEGKSTAPCQGGCHRCGLCP